MAEDSRTKPASKQSITRHPLFPATVALWFGALFGLGSLAIRPSLVEAIVLQFQLDALIPLLAPPLGATTRIMLALFMAGAGGILGAVLARRIARPKPVARERKRSAKPDEIKTRRELSPQIAISEDAPADVPVTSSPTGRRRALAMQDEGSYDLDLDERAPLPGGSPRILDVSEFDLDGFESADELAVSAPSNFDQAASGAGKTDMDNLNFNPFDSAGSREDAEAPPEGAQVFQPAAETADIAAPAQVDAEVEERSPFGSTSDDFAEPVRVQPFAPPEPVADAPSEQVRADSNTALPRFDLADAGASSSVFSERKPETPLFERPAASIDPRPVDDAQTGPQEAAPANPFSNSSAKQDAPFGRQIGPDENFWDDDDEDGDDDSEDVAGNFASLSADASGISPASVQPDKEPAAPDGPAVPQAFDASGDAPPMDDDGARQDAFAHAAVQGDAASAAERICEAELGALSHVELLERLAISLKRRREAPAMPAPQKVERAPMPQTSAVAADDVPDFSAPASVPTAAAEPAETPGAVTVPAALRPIGIEDGAEDIDQLPSFIPPRHIGAAPGAPLAPPPIPAEQPAQSSAERAFDAPQGGQAPSPAVTQAFARNAPQPVAAASVPSAYDPEIDPDDAEDERMIEEGYSSLLNLSRPAQERGEFVRIEEPAAAQDEIEPVVVFPGQEQGQSGAFAKPAAQSQHAMPRFDDPGAAPTAAPSQPEAGRQRDNAESERALRAALATLQRMSGAA